MCGCNAFGRLVYGTMKQMGHDMPMFSRLFTNYWAMLAEAMTRPDHALVLGSATRTMFDSAGREGLCPESEWSYRISTYRNRPNAKAIALGQKVKITSYSVLTSVRDTDGGYDLDLIKRCIAWGNCPMVNVLYWDHLRLSEYCVAAPDANNPINPSMDNHALVLTD